MLTVFHPRRDAPARTRASSGFTLIEILVVVSLVAGLTVILMMSMNGGMNGLRLRSEAKTIASELRRARSQAISTGTVQAFRIVPEDRTWTGARGRKGEIPKPLVVTFTGVRQVIERDGEGVILFFEDGASTGGRVQLRHERAALNVDVAWLTGEVSLHRGEATAR
ncbi:MAG: prepilin-type N-terminal cleavage/methylation domain-containing protein [Lysobacter sp.]|nr:prepilin-type N-terminal cleavage/methylation domain-containing protein [Lysobacter sp.]